MSHSIEVSDAQARAYGATSFSAAVLGGIFNVFYIEVYDQVYGLDESWFHFGQILFAIWNALNDPLFGYLNDRTSGMRLKALKRGGIAWSLAFLLPWIPLIVKPRDFAQEESAIPEIHSAAQRIATGLHFLIAICLFDTFYTYVMIVHSALLADITTNADERDKLNKWRQYGSIMGALCVVGSFYLYDRTNLTSFRVYCFGMSGLAALGFNHTASNLALRQPSHARHGLGARQNEPSILFASLQDEITPIEPLISPGVSATGDTSISDTLSFPVKSPILKTWRAELGVMLRYMRQVMKMRNFQIFVCVNFLQYFQQYFNSNFFPFFERAVFGSQDNNYSFWRGITTFSIFLLPPFCVLGLSQIRHKYAVIQVLNVGKVIFSLIAVLVFGSSPVTMGFFMVVINVMNGAAFGFFDLVVADIVDEDMVRHSRVRPLATMMHGTQSMLVKPAQSLAPMIGLALMRKTQSFTNDGEKSSTEQTVHFVWMVIVLVPAICSLAQVFLWSKFQLHGDYLASIKQRRLTSQLSGEFSPY